MLVSNLFMTVTLGTIVSARVVQVGKSERSFQRPLENPTSSHSTPIHQSCSFTPSLPMPPASFTSTLSSSLYHHLPNVLLSHSFFTSGLPNSSPSSSDSYSPAPVISTLSLSEETGDSSLQGIFLGLVYTTIGKAPSSSSHPKPHESQPKPHRRPPPPPPTSDDEEDFDKSWGHINNHEIRAPIHSLPQTSPSMEMRRCFTEAVDGVRESRLVEGTLEFPKEGGRLRFLVWRVD